MAFVDPTRGRAERARNRDRLRGRLAQACSSPPAVPIAVAGAERGREDSNMGLMGSLSHDELLSILVRLPASSHAAAAAVCKTFRECLSSDEYKLQRRAAGYEEQYYVAAGGYAGNSCAAAWGAVLTSSGWHPLPDLPRHVDFGGDGTEGVNEGCAVAVGDTIYVLGGEGSGEPGVGTKCVFSIQPHLYEHEGDLRWRFAPEMPASLSYHVAGAYERTMIVVAGGRADPAEDQTWAGWYGICGETTDATYRLDTQTGVWTEGSPMPQPRMAAVGCVIDGVLHVVGGYRHDWDCGDGDGRVYDGSTIFSYDVAADVWNEHTPAGEAVPEWSTNGHNVMTAVAKDGLMYIISTHDRKGRARTIELRVLDPVTFTFTRGPDLPSNSGTTYGGLRAGLFHGKITVVGTFCSEDYYILDESSTGGAGVSSWRSLPAACWISPMTQVATVYK